MFVWLILKAQFFCVKTWVRCGIYCPRRLRARLVRHFARKLETDASGSKHTRDMRMPGIALSSIFFFTPAGARCPHKQIPPKTATSAPSEHPEAERRRESRRLRKVHVIWSEHHEMYAYSVAKEYTRSVTSTDLYIPHVFIAALATGNAPWSFNVTIFQKK